MFAALFGLSILLAANEFSESPATDMSRTILKRSKRVVGGDMASIYDVPYMVNIRRNGVFECGGALITSQCVITAAHCVKNNGRPDDFIVRGGVTYLNELKNSRRVKLIFVHEFYNNKTLNNDLAIFKLELPLKIGRGIRPVQLASKLPDADASESIQVSGWGLTKETALFPSNRLNTAKISIMPHSLCKQLYKGYRNITANMFCASIPGMRDACSGDSGGPAVANGKLLGIVSWGRSNECARDYSPGVYVNIPSVRDWIDSIIEKNC